jgi:hypothetical protein
MGEMRSTYKCFSKNLKERHPLGKIDVDERMILKWVLEK